jgi:hypothetical protein
MMFLITQNAVVSARRTQNVKTSAMGKKAMDMLSNVTRNEEAHLKAEVNSYLLPGTYQNVHVCHKVGVLSCLQ